LAAYEKIRYEVAEHVATVILDDPETRNSLSDQLLREVLDALRAAKADEDVRVVVLTSSHERVFSSGANLGGFSADAPTSQKFAATALFPQVFVELGELGKPSILAANGHVLAGALGIALACDLIVAKDTAGFGTPEINVGLFPFMIMALIYRNVPRKRTTEMLLLGERLTAEQAREAGIVNKVVGAAEFDAAVGEWAAKLASKSPLIMRLGKDAMWRQLDMPLADALDYLRSQLTIELSTEDAIEGVSAFFEKREPEWKGR
jgi:enoyl-CoA hydratase/carnithine racemase